MKRTVYFFVSFFHTNCAITKSLFCVHDDRASAHQPNSCWQRAFPLRCQERSDRAEVLATADRGLRTRRGLCLSRLPWRCRISRKASNSVVESRATFGSNAFTDRSSSHQASPG